MSDERIRELVRRGAAQADARKVLCGEVRASKPLRAVRRWLTLDPGDERLSYLTVFGSTGSGKTFANTWMVNEVVGAGSFMEPEAFENHGEFVVNQQVRMWYAPELIEMLMSCRFARDGEQSNAIRKRFYVQHVPLLIITDLGREALDGQGYALNALFSLINSRYGSELRTSIDSNLSLDQLKVRYGEAFMDRLSGHGVFVDCTDEPSMRGTATT